MIELLALVASHASGFAGSEPSYIESVGLTHLKSGEYRVRVKAKGVVGQHEYVIPTSRKPSVSIISDPGIGPVVLVQVLNGQADLLCAISHRRGKWSFQKVGARFGFFVTRGRLGQVYIEARESNYEWLHDKTAPSRVSVWYVLKEGLLTGPVDKKPKLASPDD